MDGKESLSPINADIVKKYYAWDDKGNDVLKLKTWEGGSGKQKWRKKKKKNRKKRFKVKTWKDSLNHKKIKKEKTKVKLKTRQGRLDYKWDT